MIQFCPATCEARGTRHRHCDSCPVPTRHCNGCGNFHCFNTSCSRYDHDRASCERLHDAIVQADKAFTDPNKPDPYARCRVEPEPGKGKWVLEADNIWAWHGRKPCSPECVGVLGHWCGGCEEPERYLEKQPEDVFGWGVFTRVTPLLASGNLGGTTKETHPI